MKTLKGDVVDTKELKILKVLKNTSILNGIFCFCCITSNVCFAINHYYGIYTFFGIGLILLYGWIFNPFGIITFIWSLKVYLKERKLPDAKKIIGLKWIWIVVWFIITIVFWGFGGCVFIYFTGGV